MEICLLPARNSDTNISKVRCQDVSGCPPFCLSRNLKANVVPVAALLTGRNGAPGYLVSFKRRPRSSQDTTAKKISPLFTFPAAHSRAFWMLWHSGSGGDREQKGVCAGDQNHCGRAKLAVSVPSPPPDEAALAQTATGPLLLIPA